MIDALLFVFGYRARKIRSKKLSVLIHNSEKHRDIGSCTVSIHFQRIIDLVCLRQRLRIVIIVDVHNTFSYYTLHVIIDYGCTDTI